MVKTIVSEDQRTNEDTEQLWWVIEGEQHKLCRRPHSLHFTLKKYLSISTPIWMITFPSQLIWIVHLLLSVAITISWSGNYGHIGEFLLYHINNSCFLTSMITSLHRYPVNDNVLHHFCGILFYVFLIRVLKQRKSWRIITNWLMFLWSLRHAFILVLIILNEICVCVAHYFQCNLCLFSYDSSNSLCFFRFCIIMDGAMQ